MEAAAELGVERAPGPAGRTRISRLHSEAPYLLRPTHPVAAEPVPCWRLVGQAPARVALVAGAGGPLGGDRLSLDIDVGPGAVLVLRAVAATLVLPGPHGQRSYAHVTARVAAGGTLVWLPGPTIAARGCDHHGTTRIDLAPDARLLVREELVLGRTGEQPGTVRQRLRVTVAGVPLHDQELHLGAGAPGWTGPAVTAGCAAVGSLLFVDPTLDVPAAAHLVDVDADSATLPVGHSGRLVTALAVDALALRRRLDLGLCALGPPPLEPAGAPDGDGMNLPARVAALATSG
ncbi:urease accessory protein UreD [Blastococcus sp. TF02-09]|uniref:urease accessory protein UreD n=1 Tax=Blastococcus sp. TF02-09 TaxID=2250576 RepID=UPI000DE8AE9E|nr:urease accessory protein UreD [Blastococcus sp. TF02-9]RBY79417.1 urease accessory protein UreD [Blastococcus sp. TF02-9]